MGEQIQILATLSKRITETNSHLLHFRLILGTHLVGFRRQRRQWL